MGDQEDLSGAKKRYSCRGPYNEHARDATAKVPRTTAWRRRKEQQEAILRLPLIPDRVNVSLSIKLKSNF